MHTQMAEALGNWLVLAWGAWLVATLGGWLTTAVGGGMFAPTTMEGADTCAGGPLQAIHLAICEQPSHLHHCLQVGHVLTLLGHLSSHLCLLELVYLLFVYLGQVF